MTDHVSPAMPRVASITVRYWAAARAAAGVDCDSLPAEEEMTLADVLAAVRAVHADRPRLSDVVSVCSVLIDDRPTGTADPKDIRVHPGASVELLPPFAGG